jgi:hypothetical protein
MANEEVTPSTGGTTGESSNVPANNDAGATATEQTGEATTASTSASTKPVQPAAVDYERQYKELQRAYTRETQSRSGYEKRLEAIQQAMDAQAKHLAEMRKAPYNRDQFLKEFQDKGPDVLTPYWDEHLKGVKESYDKQLIAQDQRVRELETKLIVNERRGDTENYPDFKKLEPVIAEIMADPKCPVDFTKPMDQVVDALYQLARQSNSAEAIKAAEANGRKTADANLVRESRTTVTGGGKAVGTAAPDLSKMNLAELRKHVVAQVGEVERD